MAEYNFAHQALEAFITELTPLTPFYRGAIVSIFGRHTSNGTIEVIKATVRLDPLAQFTERPAVQVGEYIAGTFQLTTGMDTFLARLVGTAAQDGPNVVQTPMGNIYFNVNASIRSRMNAFDPVAPQNQRFTTLRIAGMNFNGVEQPKLNWALRSNPVPYRDVSDLGSVYGFGDVPEQGAELEVNGLMMAAFDTASHVDKDVAHIGVRLPKHAFPNLLSVGLLVQTEVAPFDRMRVDGNTITFYQDTERPDVVIGWFQQKVPVGAVVHCYASYAGLAMNAWTVSDTSNHPNPLRMALEVFDEGLTRMKRGFEPISITSRDASKQDELEHAVGAALWMTGFAAYRLGATKDTNAIDLMARSPNGNILVIECTHGLLPSDKRSKLIKRTHEVRDGLSKSWATGVKVLPVMVTSDKRVTVQHSIEDAHKEGIAVITSDDLFEILNRAIVIPDAEALFRELEQSVIAVR